MKSLILRIVLVGTVLVMVLACQKDEVTAWQPEEIKTGQVAFRSFDLGELQEIHDALLDRINELLSEGVFTNANANGLIPQLESLQRFIGQGEADKANQKLENVIISHLAGLHNGSILGDDQYAELNDIAHGIINEGTVTDPNIKPYPWKRMPDGKKWLTVNLDYWDGVDGQAGHYIQIWPYDGTTSEPYEGYGLLYTYGAALTACEKAFGSGWRTPTNVDWDNLILQYDEDWDMGSSYFISTVPYDDLILGGNSGFDALLGGGRYPGGSAYLSIWGYGIYWSSTQRDIQEAWFYSFTAGILVVRQHLDKLYGFSCRCVHD